MTTTTTRTRFGHVRRTIGVAAVLALPVVAAVPSAAGARAATPSAHCAPGVPRTCAPAPSDGGTGNG